MKDQIKELRVRIDGLSQLVKGLKPIRTYAGKKTLIESFKNSDEIDKAYDSLILAKAWLGKILQDLGEETPYKNDGKRKEVKDIEPAADIRVHNDEVEQRSTPFNRDSSHIEKVDWLREEIQSIIDTAIPVLKYPFGRIVLLDYQTVILQYLSEARFWLGFELGRCRDENNK